MDEKTTCYVDAEPISSALCTSCPNIDLLPNSLPPATFLGICACLLEVTLEVLASTIHGDGGRCGTFFHHRPHIACELRSMPVNNVSIQCVAITASWAG